MKLSIYCMVMYTRRSLVASAHVRTRVTLTRAVGVASVWISGTGRRVSVTGRTLATAVKTVSMQINHIAHFSLMTMCDCNLSHRWFLRTLYMCIS